MPRRQSSNLGQELSRQLFGSARRPVRHTSKKVVRGTVRFTNSILQEALGELFGVGQPRRRRRRRRR